MVNPPDEKKKITVKPRKTSQILFLLLPGVSSVTDTQHHSLCKFQQLHIIWSLVHIWGWHLQSWLHHRERLKSCHLHTLPLPLHLTASYFCLQIPGTGLPKCSIFRHRNYMTNRHSQGGPGKWKGKQGKTPERATKSVVWQCPNRALGKANFQGHTCITGWLLESSGSKKAPSFRRQSVPTTFHRKVWASNRSRGSLTKPTPKEKK